VEPESPIPPVEPAYEAAPAEPQAYVPPIRLEGGEPTREEEPAFFSPEERPGVSAGPEAGPPWEAEPAQEVAPPIAAPEPEQQEAPSEGPKEEKHFFWE
jgi:hypothetical protein